MTLFLKLLLSHFVGDFCLQPGSWVEDKEKHKIRSPKLYFHIGVHALLLLLLLSFDFKYWGAFVVVLLSHLLIDTVKLYAQNLASRQLLFFADQALHIAVITGVVYMYEPLTLQVELPAARLLLFLTFLVFVTFVSAIIVKTVISRWSPSTEDDDNASLSRAGRFIGILERLFVFVFIITGQLSAVGFLIAAKSVFRFGDLRQSKDRKLTEYILIGTLLSFGLAIFSGLLYNLLAPAL